MFESQWINNVFKSFLLASDYLVFSPLFVKFYSWPFSSPKLVIFVPLDRSQDLSLFSIKINWSSLFLAYTHFLFSKIIAEFYFFKLFIFNPFVFCVARATTAAARRKHQVKWNCWNNCEWMIRKIGISKKMLGTPSPYQVVSRAAECSSKAKGHWYLLYLVILIAKPV